MAVLLIGLFALAFGAAAVLMILVGLMAIFGLGGVSAGVLGGVLTIVLLGLPLGYVTYLLGRATWRIHSSAIEQTSGRSQRRVVGGIALFVAVAAVGSLGFPFVPTAGKVMAILMTILVGVVVIAATLEPPKRRRPGQGG